MELSDKVRLIVGAVVLLIIVGVGLALFSRSAKKTIPPTKFAATQTQEMTTSPTQTPTPTPTGTPSVNTSTQTEQTTTSQTPASTASQTQSSPSQNQSASGNGTTTQSTDGTTTTASPFGGQIIMQQQQSQHVSVSIGGRADTSDTSSNSLDQSQTAGGSTQSQSL